MLGQRFRALAFALGSIAATTIASTALAEESSIGLMGFGPTVGFSTSPDQILLGGFADLGVITPPIGLKLAADIGFGDNFTVITAGPSVVGEMPLGNGYGFAGLYLGFGHFRYSVDETLFGVDLSFNETKLIAAIDAGYQMYMENGNGLLLDLKIGVSDWHPDLKAGVGYILGGGN